MTGRPDYLDEWDLDELFPPTSNGNGHAAEAPTGPSVPEIPGAPHREVKAHLRPEGGEPKPAPQAAEPPVEPRPEPQRQAGSISLPGHDLEPRDYKRLAASGISPELAAQAQLRRVDSNEGKAIVGGNGSGDYAGIVFPYIWPGQTRPREYRLRRDHPPIEYKNGKPREKDKYLSPPGRGNMVYFAPGADPEWLLNSDIPVVLTEGEKKTLALSVCARHGLSDATEPPRLLSIGVSGVWNWRGIIGKENGPDGDRRDEKGVIPDFDRLAWKGRKVTILFDTNVRDNEDVQWACRALTKELRRRGADVLWFNWPDDTPAEVNGIDDLIGLWGAEKVLGLITSQAHLIKPAGRSQARSEGADKRVNLEASSFRLTDDAVIYTDRDDPDKGPLRICDRLEVVSYTRDTHGNEWGRQLNWNDLEGRLHDWAMPMSLLAGDGTEVRARLMSEGLRIAPGP